MSLKTSHGLNPDVGVFKFVEVKTKLTSLLVFFYCIAFAFYRGFDMHWPETLLFFMATLLIDLCTTAINNYQGYRKENETLSIKACWAKPIIFFLFIAATACGLLLLWLTQDALILISGSFCFLIGLSYTTGPLPISHTPFGEFFSGVLYGFFIPFIFALINLPKGRLIHLDILSNRLFLNLDWPLCLALLGLCVFPTALVANVMLANNTCDVAKDEAIGRLTLPHYLGKHALSLFALLNYMLYPLTLVLVVFRVFSPWQLLVLLTFPLVHKNTKAFRMKPDKETTFGLSLMNLTLVMGSLTLSLLLAAFL